MDRIGVITNPSSRRNRRDARLHDRLRALLGPDDLFVTTESAADLGAAVLRLRDAGISLLAINGGDGTTHAVLTAFVAQGGADLPKVVLLRGGTMNTVSNSLGIRGNPESILRSVVARRAAASPLPTACRDLMCIASAERTDYGFIFGTGLFHQFLREYYAAGDVSPWVAAKTLGAVVGSVLVQGEIAQRITRLFRAEVLADGRPWLAGEFRAVVASSQEQLGLGFRPFMRCREAPGRFHAVSVRGSIFDLVAALPAVRAGRPLTTACFDDSVVASMLLRAPERIPYIIDGELYEGPSEIEVRAGPPVEFVLG